MTIRLDPSTMSNPTYVQWFPLEQPNSSLRITIAENTDGDVIVEGLALPQEQLEGLNLLLEVWKYGLIDEPQESGFTAEEKTILADLAAEDEARKEWHFRVPQEQ